MAIEMLKAPIGANKKEKRLGRGPGSGTGKTSGKGNKGQNARKSGGVSIAFEGGQTPLYRRLPKRGFKNFPFKKFYNEINLYLLNKFENGSVVKFDDFEKNGLISRKTNPVKILGVGDISKKLEIHANKFSKSAIEKIEKAGGKAIIVE
jgi:large subunit ribosomal protein L15